jgi:acetylornithine deacetylase/succinyl-diaminopimelate desuccinylase-like protein
MPGPIWRLVWALGSLVDPSGKILIKDFYDDVVAPTEKELRAVQGLNWDATALLEEAGIREFPGGKSTPAAVESFVFDSTMGLSGIAGGYVYPERKSVVPSHATAIMRVALVPNQTAEQVVEKVRKHLDAHGFADIELEYAKTENSWARSPIDSPLALAMARSLEGAFGREVVFQPSFASSGPLGLFQKLFPGMDHAYSGFGPPESRVHAPNEYIIVDDYLRGIESVARFLVEYAEVIS